MSTHECVDGCYEPATVRVYRPKLPIESVYLCPRHAEEAIAEGMAISTPPTLESNMPYTTNKPKLAGTENRQKILRALDGGVGLSADALAEVNEAARPATRDAANALRASGLVAYRHGVYSLTPAGQAWVAEDRAAILATATPNGVEPTVSEDPPPVVIARLRERVGSQAEEIAALRARLADKDRQIEELHAVVERYTLLRRRLAALQGAIDNGYLLPDTDEELISGLRAVQPDEVGTLRSSLADAAALADERLTELRELRERLQQMTAAQAASDERAKELALLTEEIHRLLSGVGEVSAPWDRPIHDLRAYEAALGARLAAKDTLIRELQEKADAYRTLRTELLAPVNLTDDTTDDELIESIHRLGFEGATADQDYHALRRSLTQVLGCPPSAPDNVLVATATRAALVERAASVAVAANNAVTPPPYPPAPIPRGIGLSQAIHALQEAKEAERRAHELDQLYSHADGLVPLTVAEVRHLVDLHSDRAEALIAEAKGVLR